MEESAEKGKIELLKEGQYKRINFLKLMRKFKYIPAAHKISWKQRFTKVNKGEHTEIIKFITSLILITTMDMFGIPRYITMS